MGQQAHKVMAMFEAILNGRIRTGSGEKILPPWTYKCWQCAEIIKPFKAEFVILADNGEMFPHCGIECHELTRQDIVDNPEDYGGPGYR